MGRQGEEAAESYLKENGYRILDRNFLTPRGEIDLIATHQHILVFVEVKSRSSDRWGRPSAAVHRSKRLKLGRAAHDYLKTRRFPRTVIRFDIIEVLGNEEEGQEIRHLENAFRPPGDWRYH